VKMALRLLPSSVTCTRPVAVPRPTLNVSACCTASSSTPTPQTLFVRPTQGRRQIVARARVAAEPEEGVPAIAEQPSEERDAESRAFAIACASEADLTKCQDISVLHVSPLISWTSYMVFATVFSRPQLLAALARIEMMVDEQYPDRVRQNQPGSSPWECLDYGDVVVHLFTAEQRETYDVEGFYAAAEEVDLPFAVPADGGEAPAKPQWTRQY